MLSQSGPTTTAVRREQFEAARYYIAGLVLGPRRRETDTAPRSLQVAEDLPHSRTLLAAVQFAESVGAMREAESNDIPLVARLPMLARALHLLDSREEVPGAAEPPVQAWD